MSRKREKPYNSRHIPYSYPKRRRPLPTVDQPKEKPAPPPAVVVIGLPEDCSVLDLKSRFEIYGPISRIRIDPQGVGFVSFRSQSAAESALSSAISVHSHPVQVMWASEMNGEGGVGEERERKNLTSNSNSNSSKLLKGETPLSRLGRGNRLSSAIVNPNSSISSSSSTNNSSALNPSFKAREIVAYDDIF